MNFKTVNLRTLLHAVKSLTVAAAFTGAAALFAIDEGHAAGGAHVFFKNLKDGENVSSPVKVEMGVEGMTLAKVGSTGAQEGHHHIIIDGAAVPKGEVVPSDATHLHFGQAQTETNVELPAGKHTLTLQLADGLHRSFGPDLSARVSINVIPK